jgi:26S proteasome regulatory subunit N6
MAIDSDQMDVVGVDGESLDALTQEWEALEELESTAAQDVLQKEYKKLALNPRIDDVSIAIKEKCIYKLARISTSSSAPRAEGDFGDIVNLLKEFNEFFSAIPKSKTAKIVRNVLDIVSNVPDSQLMQIALCEDVVTWCKAETRTFLRQRIESRLAALLVKAGRAPDALKMVIGLLAELKKLDDKQMLTEVHLTEARIYYDMKNTPKAKASLTASRTAANSIYVTPSLQAELDEMSGMLQCEEGDSATAFSYFLEAFEGYEQGSNARAVLCLKYMILCKILGDNASDVPGLLSGKHGLKYAGPELEAMGAVSAAAKERSLDDFQAAVEKHANYLRTDILIARHLDIMYERMFEANLLKLIGPFNCVEIAHIANLINQPVDVVEKKLSQMILDRKLAGILDQGRGHLIVYETSESDTSFTQGAEIIKNLGLSVEELLGRAKGLGKGKKLPPKEDEKKKKDATTDDKKKEKA